MECAHIRCVALADTVTDAPVALGDGPAQASDFGSVSGGPLARIP